MKKEIKQIAMIFISMMILIMSWEGQKTDAAMSGGPNQTGAIPQASIRLRILANSDRPGDQLVKREIRDAVVQQMDVWVQELENPQSLEQARQLITGHLPEIEHLVGAELAQRGITYGYQVELGDVPFPTKMYGGLVYPAGNYEALRVTLGSGKGQNWWCVLFPPLCFIDAGSGEAAATTTAQTSAAAGTGHEAKLAVQKAQPEIHFFLWDVAVKIWGWVSGLFA